MLFCTLLRRNYLNTERKIFRTNVIGNMEHILCKVSNFCVTDFEIIEQKRASAIPRLLHVEEYCLLGV
jgi:hypothetical protein